MLVGIMNVQISMNLGGEARTEAYRAEYAEKNKDQFPFPLDNSTWSRLVGIRMKRERRELQSIRRIAADFWTYLYTCGKGLERERDAKLRAQAHWFAFESRLGGIDSIMKNALAQLNEVKVKYDLKRESKPEAKAKASTLDEAEAEWLTQKQKAWPVSEGKHWVADTCEAHESHLETPAAVKALNFNALKKFAREAAEVIILPARADVEMVGQ